MDSISDRIKKAMEINGLKQADLVKITGIGKSSISTYISGDYAPKQKNIYKLAKALNVNEAWLMGLDVPMKRIEYEFINTTAKAHISFNNSNDFKDAYDKSTLRHDKISTTISSNLLKLNNDGKKMMLDYSQMLLENPMFKNEISATRFPELEVNAASENNPTKEQEASATHTMEDDKEWE